MNCDRSDPRPVATLPTGVSCYYRCNRGIMSLPLSQFRYRYEFLSGSLCSPFTHSTHLRFVTVRREPAGWTTRERAERWYERLTHTPSVVYRSPLLARMNLGSFVVILALPCRYRPFTLSLVSSFPYVTLLPLGLRLTPATRWTERKWGGWREGRRDNGGWRDDRGLRETARAGPSGFSHFTCHYIRFSSYNRVTP